MDPIAHALKISLSRLTEEHRPERLIVGLSGGVDSVVLLHALTRLQTSDEIPVVEAVYINHGLSPNAASWQTFCASFCASLAVPFTAYTVEVMPAPRESLEACAREQRYAALTRHAKACNGVILTAHHQNDQVETVLLQLKRGAGPKGLGGIPALTRLHDVTVVRPLLEVSRQQIEVYALAQQLHWIEDESNADDSFDRNFLRQLILPPVMSRWPSFGQTVARSAGLCAEQQGLLDEVCDERLQSICSGPERISVSGLKRYSQAWQKALLRRWLENRSVPMPGSRQLEQLLLMLEAKPDAQPVVVLGIHEFRRFQDALFLLTKKGCPGPSVEGPLPLNKTVTLDALSLRLTLSTSAEGAQYEVKTVTGNSLFSLARPLLSHSVKPLDAAHHKPLKQWLKLWGIAPWERTDVLLLSDTEQALAVVLKGKIVPLSSVGDASVYLQVELTA
ncbi:tRNA(Ile)-lysidine synthase [Alteromonas lipolytica]|uniref:tRNA(Ile)-lysidine synthase n=2 Tax=Alteromonas lipolytica TaxID=1856405 RepID=A0A1E8FF55_9ALTE|nr:tRNA lysidine(34) synthetase TilS [Alteromonas lipolytica]GGF51892.1 tRNA(Ile)-lysidine synthase [Alteromonas lipolytica]